MEKYFFLVDISIPVFNLHSNVGSYAGYYPYPFIDVTQLGYGKVFVNSFGMLIAFLLVSILFAAIDTFKKNPGY